MSCSRSALEEEEARACGGGKGGGGRAGRGNAGRGKSDGGKASARRHIQHSMGFQVRKLSWLFSGLEPVSAVREWPMGGGGGGGE